MRRSSFVVKLKPERVSGAGGGGRTGRWIDLDVSAFRLFHLRTDA